VGIDEGENVSEFEAGCRVSLARAALGSDRSMTFVPIVGCTSGVAS
jgi:hypothetical protein